FWIADGIKGISKFDPDNQKFHPWRNTNFTEINITNENITNIFQDSKGRIWMVIFGRGIALLNKKDNNLKLFSFNKDSTAVPKWESTAYPNDIREDKYHIFWIGSHAGLIKFNPDTELFQVFRDTTHGKENNSRHAAINNVFIADDGMIWTGNWGAGIKKFDPNTEHWDTYNWDLQHLENSTRNIAFSIINKSEHELWVATLSGLHIFDISTRKFTKMVSIKSGELTISGTKLFADGEGNIWCSGFRPLTKFEINNNNFYFQEVPDNTVYGSGHVLLTTFLDIPADSMLFIGTYHSKGLYSMNKRTGEIKNHPLTRDKVFHENINQLLLDRDKILWVCYNNAVQIFNFKSKQFQLPSSLIKNVSFLNSGVSAALEDDDGSIWFASRDRGLLHYNKKQNVVTVFSPVDNRMPSDYILSLFKDSKGNIWAGFHGRSGIGIIGIDRKNIKFYNNSTYKIPGADVWSIAESKEGNIFFSLHDYGLGEITNPLSGNDAFRLFTKTNGLPGNKVISVVKDKKGNLWVATNDGLAVCNTTGMSFEHFNEQDGLRENNIESPLYIDESGKIYIGNSGGFQSFNPDFLNNNKTFPPVVLHSFKINGKEYEQDINKLTKIFLDHRDANFSFEYAALTFTNNDRIKYAYRLKGLEKEWRYADKQRIAAYSLAHGGTYTLQVKASNAQGEWNEKPYELIIEVKPPFWETWWFIILSALTLGLLVTIVARHRIKSIRAAEERKTHINKIKAEAEMKALRAQMNPHFIFNCMNTIDAYIHKNNTEAASDFLNKFSKLIRQVLENSQYPVISIKKDMEALQLYIELEEQRHDFRFTHVVLIPKNLIEQGYKIPPLLIQPYVENAILHGLRHKDNGKGLLTISIEEKENQLICIVEDNGIGRKASSILYQERKQHHQSLGLNVSKERIESLDDIYKTKSTAVITDKADGAGTIVKLFLPIIREWTNLDKA
ncbi:MAG: two-component regulator propeller domain-containing protein, partial [Ferruginibacter sp.]